MSSSPKSQPTFEFTKRKRWADLLITELADAIILILSYNPCKILYCGTGVTELLGWKEDELIDVDIGELLSADDYTILMKKCDDSMRGNSEIIAHVRLKHKQVVSSVYREQQQAQADPTHSLFEIKARPHYTPNPNSSPHEHATTMDFRCFFAVAKPYPSRNTTMLNEFLELKMQNELLQQRLHSLKEQAVMTESVVSSPNSSNGSPSLNLANSSPTQQMASASDAVPSQLSMPHSNGNFYIKNPYNEMLANTFDVPTAYTASTSTVPLSALPTLSATSSAFEPAMNNGKNAKQEPAHELEDVEGSTKKKKIKKTHESDKYVCITCGRTESPEWRKGPLGPKTLCNACGLRYAKQVKK